MIITSQRNFPGPRAVVLLNLEPVIGPAALTTTTMRVSSKFSSRPWTLHEPEVTTSWRLERLADLLVILLCIVFWVQLRPSNLRQSCLWNLLLLTVFSILDISLAYYLFDGRYDRPWSEWITLVLWLVSSQSLRHFFDSSHATRFD